MLYNSFDDVYFQIIDYCLSISFIYVDWNIFGS